MKIKTPKNVKPNTFKNVTNTVPEKYVDQINNYLENNKNKYELLLLKEFKNNNILNAKPRVTNSFSINKHGYKYYKHKEIFNIRINKKESTYQEFLDTTLSVAKNIISSSLNKYDSNDNINAKAKISNMANIETSVGKDDYVMKIKIIIITDDIVIPK